MDKINIKNLRVVTKIGVPDDERSVSQSLSIDLNMYPYDDLKNANDEIKKTINYFDVCVDVRKTCENNSYKLLESLACTISKNLLNNFKIKKIKISIKKFIIPDTDFISVEMTFKNDNNYTNI